MKSLTNSFSRLYNGIEAVGHEVHTIIRLHPISDLNCVGEGVAKSPCLRALSGIGNLHS